MACPCKKHCKKHTEKDVAAAAVAEVAAPKRHKCRKTFFVLSLLGTLCGVGYTLWKRSEPKEDPWAEAYWADAPQPRAGETLAKD